MGASGELSGDKPGLSSLVRLALASADDNTLEDGEFEDGEFALDDDDGEVFLAASVAVAGPGDRSIDDLVDASQSPRFGWRLALERRHRSAYRTRTRPPALRGLRGVRRPRSRRVRRAHRARAPGREPDEPDQASAARRRAA